MSFQLDKSGQAVAFAQPERETTNMTDDRQWREMTADPKFRRVLVTNGRSLVAMLEDTDGVKLSVWRLDGENIVEQEGPMPPATPDRH